VANKNFTVKNGLEVGGQEVISSSGTITSAALGGQVLGTSASPSFANITTAGYLRGPASFVIDPAAHGDDTGTVVIAGNLQVDGTQTTINSTTMTVDDLNLTLASGAANAAAANGAGITVDISGATNPSLVYGSSNDDWNFNKNLNVTGTGHTNFQVISNSESTKAFIQTVQDSDVRIGSSTNHPVSFYQNGSERMRVDASGRVGIGTSSPLNQLVISEGTGQHGIEFAAGTTSYIQAYDRATSDYGNLRIDAQKIGFGLDNGAEKVTFLANGNVGIGITGPAHPLHVYEGAGGYYASIGRGNSVPGSADPWLGLFNNVSIADATYGWGMYDSNSDGSFQIWGKNNSTTGYNALTIKRGGKIGIGQTSGEANLVVRDPTNGTHSGGRIGFGIHEAGALQMFDAVTMSRTAGSVVTDSTASGGENVTLSSGQLYGPYHTLPRGQYRMCVKIKTTNASYDGDAARITLHVSSGTVVPESRIIRGIDFGTNNKWQTFSIPFQVVGAATNAVEFYLFALNSQAISVDYFFIMNDTDSYSTKVFGNQVVDGHVGIGTQPTTYLTSGYKLRLDGGTQTYISFNNSTHTTQVLGGFVIGNDASAARITQRENQPIIFSTNNTNKMTITADGRIGFGEEQGNSGHRDVEGKMDLRMDMAGQNWTENDWASVFNASGSPGSLFNKSVLHLDTNRFGGATGGIVGIAFSPGWQGHQNWGIYSHNRSGGTSSQGDLSFVNQMNDGTIQERFRLRADGLTVFPTGFASTPYTYEKILQRGFANGVANQKCYIVLGTEFWGQLEISLTGTYSNQNMVGILKRSYAIGVNTSGTVYNNESHTIQEEGATANNFALGEVEYDSSLAKYKIPIAHINSAGNTLEIRIKALIAGTNQDYLLGMQEAYVTNVITTNTTVYKKQTRESACHVYHTGGQSINATPSALSFTSTLFDPGDCFSGSEYTAPEGGVYAFNVTYLIYPHANGVTTMSWQKYSGGGWSQYGAGIQNGASGQSHTQHSYPTLIELSAGEKVRAVVAIGGFTGSPTVYGNQNSFTAHKV